MCVCVCVCGRIMSSGSSTITHLSSPMQLVQFCEAAAAPHNISFHAAAAAAAAAGRRCVTVSGDVVSTTCITSIQSLVIATVVTCNRSPQAYLGCHSSPSLLSLPST